MWLYHCNNLARFPKKQNKSVIVTSLEKEQKSYKQMVETTFKMCNLVPHPTPYFTEMLTQFINHKLNASRTSLAEKGLTLCKPTVLITHLLWLYHVFCYLEYFFFSLLNYCMSKYLNWSQKLMGFIFILVCMLILKWRLPSRLGATGNNVIYDELP